MGSENPEGMQYESIKTLKKQTEHVLREYSHTRNDDRALVKIVCETFGYDGIEKATSIERCRRWFNQRKQYLPTDERVARQRKMNLEEWRAAMGYPTTSGSYVPPSMENKKTYTFRSNRDPRILYEVVDLGTRTYCTCPSFRFRQDCKHVQSVLSQARQPVGLFG